MKRNAKNVKGIAMQTPFAIGQGEQINNDMPPVASGSCGFDIPPLEVGCKETYNTLPPGEYFDRIIQNRYTQHLVEHITEEEFYKRIYDNFDGEKPDFEEFVEGFKEDLEEFGGNKGYVVERDRAKFIDAIYYFKNGEWYAVKIPVRLHIPTIPTSAPDMSTDEFDGLRNKLTTFLDSPDDEEHLKTFNRRVPGVDYPDLSAFEPPVIEDELIGHGGIGNPLYRDKQGNIYSPKPGSGIITFESDQTIRPGHILPDDTEQMLREGRNTLEKYNRKAEENKKAEDQRKKKV